ncbi:hypothetical protein V2S66_31270 [Streptomyces sp. V4-01]|uniref:Uncharacterized protein n=1 Tax=Actinacidiphila polyblastidii TaxID=3110430 RepID=A0ABU7PMH5_9ACTN|nr:hypothetical protein [Streptomyces sp. V4-01]
MDETRIRALRARIAEDRRAAEADERHWSEVPSATFSATRAIAEADAKARILDMIERWTHPTPELRIVAGELLDGMEAVYASDALPEFVTTEASDRYHDTVDCPAFKAGRRAGDQAHPVVLLTASEAAAARQTRCPVCLPEAGDA